MSPIFYGTLHWMTFTPEHDRTTGPWYVYGDVVVNLTTGASVIPTSNHPSHQAHDPAELCRALNRAYRASDAAVRARQSGPES